MPLPGDAAVGALAVAGAIVCFGSFGVPIKSCRVLEAQVDPLIYQLYKSLACFGSSLTVLLFKNFSWTWWGMVGATVWVGTGTLAIYAIQQAGLGLAQTTYSCLTVFVSFLWGIVFFNETGNNMGLSLFGLLLIAAGLVGLGHAVHVRPRAMLRRVPSAESTSHFYTTKNHVEQLQNGVHDDASDTAVPRMGDCQPTAAADEPAGGLGRRKGSGSHGGSFPDLHVRIGGEIHRRSISGGDLHKGGGQEDESDLAGVSPASSCKGQDVEAAKLLQLGPPGELRIILRQNTSALYGRVRAAWSSSVGRGVFAAVLIGLLNGSFLVPYKMARQDDQAQGIDYVFPFAASSLLVTLLACAVYYGMVQGRRPRLHVEAVAGPALLTGLLWSIGNVCSIYAVQLLGLSVGFPLVQCQLVVSTAWALLYYKEAPTSAASTATFAGSTIVIVVGMMLLAVYGS